MKHVRLGLAASVALAAALSMAATAGAARHPGHPALASPAVRVRPSAFYANPPAVAAASLPQLGGPAACAARDDQGSIVYRISCYRPQDMRQIYNIPDPATSAVDGRGQTILIVDAFGSPTLVDDLHAFDQTFGLPDPQLTIYQPVPNDPNADPAEVAGWAGETSLDVQWAHAIAPG